MRIQNLSTAILVTIGSLLAASHAAQAANFTTNLEKNGGPEGDIILKSVTQNGKTTSDFSFVNKANILENTPIKLDPKKVETADPEEAKIKGIVNNNSGDASTDKGDKASSPMAVSGLKDPTNTEIAAFMGNKNLNNIIDSEGTGSFRINMFFDSLITADSLGIDNILVWERGMNSDLGIQAIDASGKVIGNFLKLLRTQQASAGYSIDTMEINNTQKVGSWGVSLKDLGVASLAGVQVFANSSYGGPDFKVMARKSQNVPEPGALLGLGLVATMAYKYRQYKQIAR
ncbi:exosortase-dependent surface protein XDP2 [Calothrix sp. 336/3]|uniref:exosortase-dependent surface protein XDP2 n=1 Tax=Calothrix sp. 336/3 TaxID=1337936 RepID=UPI0004E39F09|nr:exosortase-dependent surface protein XDP2 [Calothrix sp. 336/3]AKG24221.1 hypothetical protein IJ00_25500 [Calothrix sp. 336/3]